MKKFIMDQTVVLSYLTLNSINYDLDFGPSPTQFLLTAHSLVMVNIVSSYNPATNEGVMDQTRCFSHLTLNYDIYLEPRQIVLMHCTVH